MPCHAPNKIHLKLERTCGPIDRRSCIVNSTAWEFFSILYFYFYLFTFFYFQSGSLAQPILARVVLQGQQGKGRYSLRTNVTPIQNPPQERLVLEFGNNTSTAIGTF